MAENSANLMTAQSQDEVPHHGKRKPREVHTAPMQLNLTSMIDVIFQLLIYFVITASFAVGEGVITAKLPKGTGTGTPPDELPVLPINIQLQSYPPHNVRITVQGQSATNFTDLRDRLIHLQRDPSRGRSGTYKPDNPIVIKPDGQVRWQHVVNAFNATKAAAYVDVAFASATDGG